MPHLTRALDLIFHTPAPETGEAAEKPGDVFLPDLQVRLVRRGGWTLACKGGHNGENHNHNDVGSFILMQDGEAHVGQLTELLVGDGMDRQRILDDAGIGDQEAGNVGPVLVNIRADSRCHDRACDIRTAP